MLINDQFHCVGYCGMVYVTIAGCWPGGNGAVAVGGAAVACAGCHVPAPGAGIRILFIYWACCP